MADDSRATVDGRTSAPPGDTRGADAGPDEAAVVGAPTAPATGPVDETATPIAGADALVGSADVAARQILTPAGNGTVRSDGRGIGGNGATSAGGGTAAPDRLPEAPPPARPPAADRPGSGRCSATEPDPDEPFGELDYLAARIVNGRHQGVAVERTVDLPRIEAAVREILIAVGEDPDRDGLRETPVRVARAYAELLAGLRVDPRQVLSTTFEANHDELVLVRDIEVTSLCEHHLLPFHGVAHIGYVPGPDGRITGLSKLARVVEAYARRPQVQERLTAQIADLLMERLSPRGAIVVLECEHMCMAMRGVQKAGSRTVTSAVRGMLRDDAKSRAEAMSLIIRG